MARQLSDLAAEFFAEAVMRVPHWTREGAREMAARLNAGCCVAIRGGSTIGLGKAVALESGLPILAFPTCVGSEMTPIRGLTEAGVNKRPAATARFRRRRSFTIRS